MRDQKIIKLTKIVLDFMFFSGILVTVTMPLLLRIAGNYYAKVFLGKYIPLVLIFTSASLFGVMILEQLRRMMKTVIEENCFVWENVKSLESMAVYSLTISVLFLGKVFFLSSPATGVIIIVFFVAALFSQVLSFVFRDAINYKEENDLTI